MATFKLNDVRVTPDELFCFDDTEEEIKKMNGTLKIKFSGPGLYLFPRKTIIIVPSADNVRNYDIWNGPKNRRMKSKNVGWNVYFYKVRFDKTIFSVIASIPTRKDIWERQ